MTELREGTKVALYARVSTDDRKGIQAQLDRMRRQAEEGGLEPVSHFTDMNGSREEFDWMMAQATSENPPSGDHSLRSQPVLTTLGGLGGVECRTGGERCAGNLHQGTYRQHPSVGTKRTITPCKRGPGIRRALSISGGPPRSHGSNDGPDANGAISQRQSVKARDAADSPGKSTAFSSTREDPTGSTRRPISVRNSASEAIGF